MKKIPLVSLALLATLTVLPATVLYAADNSGSDDMYNNGSTNGGDQKSAPSQSLSPAPQSSSPSSTGDQKKESSPSPSGGSNSPTPSDDSKDKGYGGSDSGY